jgi:dihydrofolate reductase
MHFDKALTATLNNCRSKREWTDALKRALIRKPRFGFNTHGNVIPVSNPGGKNITIIAAMDSENGIGKDNQIPWAISPDMQQFKRLTTGHTVIMGRKTFESLNGKCLPDRVNIVITRDIPGFYAKYNHTDLVALPSLEDALDATADEQIFIIGGGEIYRQALDLNLAHDMILTRIQHNALCDTRFPTFNERDWFPPVHSTHQLSGGLSMRYEYWRLRLLENVPLKE